jgi:hypothetical protein
MTLLSRTFTIWLMAAAAAVVSVALAQDSGRPPAAQGTGKPVFKAEELEQLTAPIALYPDSLVAQVLMASTYPLEVVEAARWSRANPSLKDKALQDALEKQKWDPSVKSLTAFPTILQMLNEKLDMTQKLGDAFLAQPKDVMDAVQRLRAKAQAAGNLKSSKEQTVSSEQQGTSTVIKIEPADPSVVYVPTYNPVVVYGPWPYPAYPPYYYYPPGYAAGAALFTFTLGIAIGANWGHCNWGGGNVYVDHRTYNNFNRTDIKTGDRGDWQHNPEHRKGVEYRDQGSREKYSGQRPGADTREAYRGRAEQGRQDIARGSADQFKGGGAADRGGMGDRGGDFGDRGGMGERGGDFGDRGGAQRAGGGAFEGAGAGGQSRDFSNRGAASRGSFSGGGGGFHGGGGRGGGGRGGGRR